MEHKHITEMVKEFNIFKDFDQTWYYKREVEYDGKAKVIYHYNQPVNVSTYKRCKKITTHYLLFVPMWSSTEDMTKEEIIEIFKK